MRTVIYEPRSSGHLLVFVRMLAEHASQDNADYRVALSEAALKSAEFRTHLGAVPPHVLRVTSEPRLRWAIDEAGPTGHVVVPHGDSVLRELVSTRLGAGQRVTLLIMRDPSWEDASTARRVLSKTIKSCAINLMKRRRNVRVVMLRSPGFDSATADELTVNDPVIANESIYDLRLMADKNRIALGLNGHAEWVGIVGGIQRRKNPVLVAHSVAECSRILGRPIGLCVIGPWSTDSIDLIDEVVKVCEDMGTPLVIENRHLTNSEMNVACLTVDLIAMAYSTNAPNSTLGKCAAFGQRIAAAGGPSIAGFVAELGFGPTAKLDPLEFGRVMAHKLEQPLPEPRSLAGPYEFSRVMMSDKS